MLELRNVSVTYQDHTGLSDASLIFAPGEIVGIFGENGAGKTTLMNSVLGFVPLSKGEILLDDKKMIRKDMHRLSYASSEHTLFPQFTALDHREFFESFYPRFMGKRYDFLTDFFDLPQKRKARQMSTGQQNQLETILALSQGADYILLDEPFAGNDIFNRDDFYKVLLGILEPTECLILSTHLIEEIKHFVGRVVLLQKSKIIADKNCNALEEEGLELISWMRDLYKYDERRVGKTLQEFQNEKEQPI